MDCTNSTLNFFFLPCDKLLAIPSPLKVGEGRGRETPLCSVLASPTMTER